MAQFSDWISRLFNAGPAKGLSGDADELSLDPRDAYFNSRLRRHESGDDIIEDPFLLWSSQTGARRRSGLREHLLTQKEAGQADFTDILVVINEADYRRTFNQVAEPWKDTAARILTAEVENFCREEGYQLLFSSRGARFRIIQDGGPEMGGVSLGLIKGEFVTGLPPNLYTGPLPGSRPVIAIHLNVPGVWDGYREVGRLYSDQVQFTIGDHWLDNFSHPALSEPALYRVQQFLDGNIVHIINPDLQDRYEVSSDENEGVSVLTISEVGGSVVAYIVMALMDSVVSEAHSAPPDEPRRLAPLPLEPAETDIPDLELDPPTRPPARPGPPDRLSSRPSTASMFGQKTIVPDTVQERIFTLKERGALLQKVHFRKFMQGYDVYVASNGTVSTHANDPAATFQVRGDAVKLVVHKPEVTVNGFMVDLNTPLSLYDRTLLKIGPHALEYNDLSRIRMDGWPYLGEILRPASSTHMVFGGRYRIGRDRRCKVQLPDEPHNENIVWLDAAAHGTTIRARSGEIPKSRFYTDSIMVASEHTEVDLRGDTPAVNSIARHCFTYVRRGDELLPLYPTKQAGAARIELQHGDDLLAGNCLFQVGFPPPGAFGTASLAPPPTAEDRQATPQPEPTPAARKLTADSLARALDSDFDEDTPPQRPLGPRERLGRVMGTPLARTDDDPLGASPATVPPDDDEPPAPPDPRQSTLDAALEARGRKPFVDDDEPPPAAGLGERGPPPAPPKIGRPGFDSILGGLPKVPAPQRGAAAPRRKPDPTPPISPISPLKAVEPAHEPVARDSTPPTPANAPPTEDPFDDEEDDIIAVVHEQRWQLELARPARLLQLGWAISGEATVGNYNECAVIIPESRAEPHQLFHATEYFRLKVRNNRGKAQLLDPDEARMRVEGEDKRNTLDIDKVEFEIIRRDADGDEDFSIVLRLDPSVTLPDPRAQLLAIDHSDRMSQALFTIGFPLKAKRKVRLGPIRCEGTYQGGELTLTNYIRSYRQADGSFLPFFVRQGDDGPFQTVPEDGRPVVLLPGDYVLIEKSLFRFTEGS
ncbi:MAG: hypothetical protein H6739_39465 [Alphaproteobacteria bacterium]|nr:hypothetical protein [Alphaproteobacteria bacterium]